MCDTWRDRIGELYPQVKAPKTAFRDACRVADICFSNLTPDGPEVIRGSQLRKVFPERTCPKDRHCCHHGPDERHHDRTAISESADEGK
jgi:hypothetical protein